MQPSFADEIKQTVYAGLQPAQVWRHFAHLNAIPRPSGHEGRARDYVEKIAQSAGAQTRTDAAGNLVIRLAARNAAPTAPIVALQSHLDMVSEKRPDIAHNFALDPIRPRRENGRIYGSGTTLGADNGIGAAMMLAVLTSPELSHGPLELIFTVQEETGLDGALGLDATQLAATMLLNLDSEDPDEITIGCAGGRGINLDIPFARENVSQNYTFAKVVIGGLLGGHSGIQINETLGNAIQILAQTLFKLSDNLVDWRLCEISGGNMRNAIPRDAQATIAFPVAQSAQVESTLYGCLKYLQMEWKTNEPKISLEWQSADAQNALSVGHTREILNLLTTLPHGVLQMSERYAGKVETSCNLATAKMHDKNLRVHISGRSFRESELDAWQNDLQEIAARHALTGRAPIVYTRQDGYPGWEPADNSRLLEVAKAVYENVYHRAAKIEIVHAGLECGIILSKRPNMEAISFGPLIRGAHTPEEWVEIGSVGQSFELLRALLQELAQS